MHHLTRLATPLAFLLLATIISAQPQTAPKTDKQLQYEAQIRKTLALDYSTPDYSTKKIDPKVMGTRLVAILEKVNECYKQPRHLSTLSAIQSHQLEGINYCSIKKMKLKRVKKQGNTITIIYETRLEPSSQDLKKAQLFFRFVDGVSECRDVNEFFYAICRYIKE